MSEVTWPSVAVVIPVLNEEKYLRRAIESILAQDYPGNMEICLALGPSIDTTDDIADELARGDVRISTIPNPTGGRSSGLNAAIRATRGEVVVRVDAHSELPRGYIARAVETLQRTGAVNVGGVQRAVGTTPFERSSALALASPFGMGGSRYRTGGAEGSVDTVFLGVFQRSALEVVGLFDESVEGNEDYELNIRLRANGGLIWFDPALHVEYRPRGTIRSLARQFFLYGSWKRTVVRMHPGSTQLRQLAPPAAVIGITASLVVSPWNPWAAVVPSAYLAAVIGASVWTGRRPADVARLMVIFPTMHTAWACGFLAGRRNRSARGS